MSYNTDDIFLSLGKLHFDMSQAQRYIILLKEELEAKDQEILRLQSGKDKQQGQDG